MRTERIAAVCLCCLLLTGLDPLQAAAHQRKRIWRPKRVEQGVSVAVYGARTSLTANFYDIYLPLRAGLGYGVQIGYRWSRYVQTYLALTYTEHDLKPGWLWSGRYGFLLGELQAVIPIVHWRRLRPAAVFGYGRAVLAGGEDSFGGVSLLAGAQLEYFLSRRVTLAAMVCVRYIDYDRVQYRLPTALAAGTVEGSNVSLIWLRAAYHFGQL